MTWNLPRLLLPKNRVKLLLNMLVIAQQTIPRGGTLTIDPVGDGETMSFRVTSAGLNARVPQNIVDMLNSSSSAVDAHAVQPYYTRLLAQACGLKVTLTPEGETVVDHRFLIGAFIPTWLTAGLQRPSRIRRGPSYLFVEAVLFHLLNQYLNAFDRSWPNSKRRVDVARRCVRRPVSWMICCGSF